MHRLHAVTQLLQPTPAHAVVLAALVVVVAVGAWLVAGLEVHEVVAAGVALEVFSGNWKYIPMPLPLDRVLFVVAIAMLVLRGAWAVSDRRLLLRPVHLAMLAALAWAAGSAFWFGSLHTSVGLYALLDRFGAVPFLLFLLAPLLFGRADQRRALLAAMVAVGCYLGVVGNAEGLGIHALVLPHYISNPALGITQERARGPFLVSDALGLSMFDAAALSLVAYREFRARWAKAAAAAVVAMTPSVLLFTLTRAIWGGAVIAAVVVGLTNPAWRRRLVPLLLVGAVAVTAAVFTVPGLKAKVSARSSTVSSVWDRKNTNDAALRAVVDHPLTGLGWEEFSTEGPAYLRTPATYPLTGVGLEVHNVFLSHAAELGLPGALLWLVAVVGAVGGALVRRGPPELRPWRTALLGIAVLFVIDANFAPLSYALPNYLLWLVAGIVAVRHTSTERWPMAPLDEVAPASLGTPALVGVR